MTKRGMSAVALAAGMMLGGSGIAAAQQSQQGSSQQGSSQSGASSQSDPSAQGGSSQQSGQQSQQQSQQQGQQADQQITMQLQKIQQQPDETSGDKLFLLSAAIDNMAEMQLSQQVMQKAKSPEVKQIAQQMVQDHQRASQQLQQVAQKLGVQVPQGLPSIKQQEIQAMAAMPAEQLEKQYIAKMNEAHAKDVTCFGGQMKLAQSQDVKQFVTQQLPILQQHQQHIMQTAATMGLINPGEAIQAGSRIRGSGASGGASGSGASGGSSSGGSSSGGSSSGGSSSGGSSSGGSSSGSSSGGSQ